MTADPFATSAVRERVLAAWAAAPVRFREDANAEEDYALGGYRDRLVVELAQNAADAAARAGVPGHLLLRVSDGVLIAANTGAPLDATGVQALATLRASAKPPGSVGRFGVGFCAVLAVTDAPAVRSRSGGVEFSAARTRAAVEQVAAGAPGLAQELARRGGHVPVLRLPFACALDEIPPGYDTAVVLPLRDEAARDLVTRLLAEVADPLLLALPGLARVRVEVDGEAPREVADVGARWHVLRRAGEFSAAQLAARPTEERARTAWSLAWALPRADAGTPGGGGAPWPRVVHAPTPSEEPLPWPALLIGTFPLEPSRRHLAPGPATDALVAAAAQAFRDLLVERAATGQDVWPLVPTGLASGVVDGALRAALAPLLPGAPLLAAAEDPSIMLRPRDAVMLEPPAGDDAAVVAALAPVIAGLVQARRAAATAFTALGVRRLALADVIEQLPQSGDPGVWRARYSALEPLSTDSNAREALAALPVPLADGRVVRGPRGLVLPGASGELAGALSTLGVRAVHPDVVHPLLERLGATAVSARGALELDAVRRFVEHSLDDLEAEDAPERVDAVLTLVRAAVAEGTLGPGDLPWLGRLALADCDGELAPAAELTLPFSLAARVFDDGELPGVEGALVEVWGAEVLRAVGVLDTLPVVQHSGVALDSTLELEGWPDWVAAVTDELELDPAGATLAELSAIGELDAVRDDAWPSVLAALAADRRLRGAVLERARIIDGLGRAAGDVPPYTAWWLRDRLAAGGGWADPDAQAGIAALLPPAPDVLAGLDVQLRRALGAVREASELDAGSLEAVLERLADDRVVLDVATALRVWKALAALSGRAGEALEVNAPKRVRVLDGGRTRVVPAAEAMVVQAPALLQRGDLGYPVVVSGRDEALALAELLDLPLAGELAPGRIDEDGAAGVVSEVPHEVRSLLANCPARWCEHESLVVDGVELDWWVDGEGSAATVHAATLEGLARGLAWAVGAWSRRAVVMELLADPDAAGRLVVDEAFA